MGVDGFPFSARRAHNLADEGRLSSRHRTCCGACRLPPDKCAQAGRHVFAELQEADFQLRGPSAANGASVVTRFVTTCSLYLPGTSSSL
eukprot:COSAG04_NODE_2592_length_3879_cov_15.585979_2_plen_89_part_00